MEPHRPEVSRRDGSPEGQGRPAGEFASPSEQERSTGDWSTEGWSTDAFSVESLWGLMEPPPTGLARDPLLGTTLGGVTLVRMVAEGGMGRVYEGDQQAPRRKAAVKVLRPGWLAAAAIERFLQESEILGSLQHPWICQVYSAGAFQFAETRLPYFVMEYVADAMPITRFAAERGLDAWQRLALMEKVCEAVAYAHARGVIHLDLKPSNILVGDAGHPKVIDFGIAREANAAQSSGAPVDERVVGTLQYMSPEQCRGEHAGLDERTDVYALGLVLYELLAGRLPYDVRRCVLTDARRVINEQPAPSLAEVAPHVSREAAALVDRCLAKDRAQRCPSVAEMRTALLGCWERRPRNSATRQSASDAATARIRRLWSGRSWRLTLAATLIVGLFAAPTWRRWSRSNRPASAANDRFRVPAAPLAQTAPSARTFRYGFRHLLEEHAQRYLDVSGGVAIWSDLVVRPMVCYWGPTANEVEGRLEFRFDFPAPTRRVRLRATAACWDFTHTPTLGTGRGAAALEASVDRRTWFRLRGDVERPEWGKSWLFDDELPPALLGAATLWIRVRLLTDGVPANANYTVAQFSRNNVTANENVFELEAELQ